MSANLATILTTSAERDADAMALKLDDAEVSYGLLDEARSAATRALASSSSP